MLSSVLERSSKMFSTQPGWMLQVEGTPVPCPSPSLTAPCPAQAPALAPATDQDPVPVHVRVLAHVKHLTPTYVTPVVPAMDPATSQTSVKAPDHVTAQDHVQALTKDRPFPHCLTVSFLKAQHSHLSLMLLTPLPQAFLPFLTSWALCRCILPGCCWCATAAWPISS